MGWDERKGREDGRRCRGRLEDYFIILSLNIV